MPTVLRTGPYRFFFFSGEGLEPPHIHVDAGDSYAKYWLEPVGMTRSVGFNGPEQREIFRLVEANRALFLDRWNEHFKNDSH